MTDTPSHLRTSPPGIEAPYFDETLDAWVLSRYADVLAAFRASTLSPSSPRTRMNAELPPEIDRVKMREETMEALSPTHLRAWREQLAPEAHALAHALPIDRPVDLLDDYARPLCLSLAAMVTHLSLDTAQSLLQIARCVSASAAAPDDHALRDSATSAGAELRAHFPPGPEALRDSGFVALTQTLPCLLGNAWFALMEHPDEWMLLHRQPGLIEQAMEELLRYAGLVRTLSRTATEDIDLNGALIRKHERISLRILAANRDPERFPHPNRVDITRRGGGHLTLGAGSHSCVAANLIRMAALAITSPLVERFASALPARPVLWQGGSGFRSPKSLWVRLAGAPAASWSDSIS